jgi:hypothetical protein
MWSSIEVCVPMHGSLPYNGLLLLLLVLLLLVDGGGGGG